MLLILPYLWSSLQVPFPMFKCPCNYSTPIQNNPGSSSFLKVISWVATLILSALNSSLSCNKTYSQQPAIRPLSSLGGLYPAYHITILIKGFIIVLYISRSLDMRWLREGKFTADDIIMGPSSHAFLPSHLQRASLSFALGARWLPLSQPLCAVTATASSDKQGVKRRLFCLL